MGDEDTDRSPEPGLVSVIIPTYNRAGLIGETLESVFSQDYRPIEVIVVTGHVKVYHLRSGQTAPPAEV